MDHPYKNITESDLIQLDWQAEKRAEARFLRETYNDWQAVFPGAKRTNEGQTTDTKRTVLGQQLDLFEGAGN